jgi:hypothetical protein
MPACGNQDNLARALFVRFYLQLIVMSSFAAFAIFCSHFVLEHEGREERKERR